MFKYNVEISFDELYIFVMILWDRNEEFDARSQAHSACLMTKKIEIDDTSQLSNLFQYS